MTKSILKNANKDAEYRKQSPNEVTVENLDRKTVIENTKINSQMHGAHAVVNDTETNDDAQQSQLKWDERNLLVNEMEKTPKMKIDEPKTPYEGGFDVNNDYYKMDPIDDLNLGEGVLDQDEPLEDFEKSESTPEEKAEGDDVEGYIEDDISEFERKRRMHYKTEANPLHHDINLDDDEDDEDDDE